MIPAALKSCEGSTNTMKIPFALAALMLVPAIGIFWHDYQRLEDLKARHAKLVAAASSSVAFFDSLSPGDEVRHTSQAQEHLRKIDNQAVARLLGSYQTAIARRDISGVLDKPLKQQLIDQHYWITELTGTQLKLLIAQALESKDLSKECLGILLDDAVFMLAEDDPQAALAILDRVVGLFTSAQSAQSVVQVSLNQLAKEDPQAAASWIMSHRDSFSKLITDNDKLDIITQAANRDPKLAFALFQDLETTDMNRAISNIVCAAKTKEHYTAVFGALRDHLVKITDETERKEILNTAMFQIAAALPEIGCEATTHWLASAQFTPAEFDAFTNVHGVFYRHDQNNENGKWAEWIGDNLPKEKAKSHIESHIERWTEDDYQAVGKWLTSIPDDPTKQAAVYAYATTVANGDPEVGAQWAMTLPPGNDRHRALWQIHYKWPKGDPEGAAAFAKEHGIK